MPMSRRSSRLRPIQSEKHEMTWSNLGENASTVKSVTLMTAVAGEPSIATDIETGSHVNSIYLETNLNGVDNSGSVQVFHWMVYKSPSGAFSIQDPSTYDTKFKKFILKRGMEMLPQIPLDSGGTIQTKRIFVVKIPKHLIRFGEGDQLILSYKSTSASAINFCGIGIYREIK